MQLIGKDEPSIDDSEAVAERWRAYLDAYVADGDTPGVPQAHLRRPFLRRYVSPIPSTFTKLLTSS